MTRARRSRLPPILMLWLAIFATGCYPEPVAITTFPPEPATPTRVAVTTPSLPPQTTPPPTPEPTPPPTATPLVLGTPIVVPTPVPGASPSAGCINGWIHPAPESAEYIEGMAILEDYMGVIGPWTVTEMRYFTGPDAPGIIEPRYDVVERWYIRAALVVDPAFRGRWLIEKRTDQVLGVSAVAPWESFGYESPDWTGFIGEGPPQTYIGLPGQWSGIPFDFVTGERDGGQPGLPPEVVDCLAAT